MTAGGRGPGFTRAELEVILGRALAAPATASAGVLRPFDTDIAIETGAVWRLRIPARGLRSPLAKGGGAIGGTLLAASAIASLTGGAGLAGRLVMGLLGALFWAPGLGRSLTRLTVEIGPDDTTIVWRLGPLSRTRRLRSRDLRARWGHSRVVDAEKGIQAGRYLQLEDGRTQVQLLALESAREQDWVGAELRAVLGDRWRS